MLRHFVRIVLLVSLLAAAATPARSLAQAPTPPGVPAQLSASPGTAPDAVQAPSVDPKLYLDGFVSSFTTASPLVYWVTEAFICDPAPDATRILRMREAGFDTARYLYNHYPAEGEPCPPRIYSNLAADDQYVYWVDRTGLVRQPVLAGLADTPETLLPAYAGKSGELVMMGDYLVGISGDQIWYIHKSEPTQAHILSLLGVVTASMLKTDGNYVYYLLQPGGYLRRQTLQGQIFDIATGVTDYTPSGVVTICILLPCIQFDSVYYVTIPAPLSIQTYDNISGSRDTVYTAALPAGLTARIYGLTAGAEPLPSFGRRIFFWEKRWTPCQCFETNSTDYLNRLSGGVLYSRASTTSWSAQQTKAGGDFIFWKDIMTPNQGNWGSVYRLPQDANAMPVVNMRVWGWEINQSVQDKDQSMFLVHNKRTFLRLYVSADGDKTVNGVTARLSAYWGGQFQGSILPVTPLITVPPYRSKQAYTNQFLFELPWFWLDHSDLTLVPELNPFAFPLEPNYADNRFASPLGPFTIRPNPRARFSLLKVSYLWKDKSYPSRDQDEIISWLYRAFPIGIDPNQAMPQVDTYSDNTTLGSRVQDFNNDKECQSLNKTSKGGNDDRNLCASYYLHAQMEMFRRTKALPTDTYIYASVNGLARGSASPTAPVANGPDRTASGTAFALAGFYAGHEIGHLLGRGHPAAMSDDPATKNNTEGCGHSRDDTNFPYFFGWIGEPSNDNYGLDSRLNVPAGSVRLMTFGEVRDVMTYCGIPDQWVSDYTYRGIYDWLSKNPGPARPEQARLPQQLQRPGSPEAVTVDGWLNVGGHIATDVVAGGFDIVQRVAELDVAPEQVPGPYTIRLLDENGATLADYPFTPVPSEESPDWLTFFESVPFAEGTHTIQVLHNDTQAVVISETVSPNPPDISAVSASRPTTAQVTLSWTASDPDGDPLSFTVLFSQDLQTFKPVEVNLNDTNLTVDTSNLPGGTGYFRIIATDGVNTSTADSGPVEIEAKPPVVHILTPSDGQQVQYSAPLNFSGYAEDLQDGSLTGDMLTWSTQHGSFATGPNATAASMPTGWVTVTLTAQNSAGLTGSASVNIYVGDDLSDPPPMLSVAPTAINLQAENDSSAPLQTQVLITNGGGGGNLDWSVDLHSTPWLSADVLSGATPYTLTLSANPAGLEAGSSHTTTLTVSAAGQNVDIPVNLQIGAGSVWTPPDPPDVPTDTERKIYLPVMNK